MISDTKASLSATFKNQDRPKIEIENHMTNANPQHEWLPRLPITLALAVGCAWSTLVLGAQDDTELNRLNMAKSQARGMAFAFKSASAKMMPSVVTVLAKRQNVDETEDTLDLLNEDSNRDFELGSGVIISADGICVTNHHVIKNAKSIRVRMADGRSFAGKDVRSDASSDVAVFRIVSKEPLPAATIGNSEAISIGDWVLAIGSPFALDQTVSVGIISNSSGRTMNLLQGLLLQTDATINPGNSGGALLDIDGELIGINTAIATTSGQFQGVGFAIPIRRVQWITKELLENGKVRRARLGVRVDPIPQSLAEELNIEVRSGVYVSRVSPDLPAEKCGMEQGDIIVQLGEQRVFSAEYFRSLVEQLPADRSYPVKVLREGKPLTLDIQPVFREE